MTVAIVICYLLMVPISGILLTKIVGKIMDLEDLVCSVLLSLFWPIVLPLMWFAENKNKRGLWIVNKLNKLAGYDDESKKENK